MTPLNHACMMPRSASGDELRAILVNNSHARIPVYEGRRSNVVGILVVLDYLCKGESARVANVTIPPVRLDANLSLNDAFKRLQDAGRTMGIVVDRQKQAVGMVTMSDLLQSLFGSIPNP